MTENAVAPVLTTRKRLSLRKQSKFLDILAQTGKVAASARAVGFSSTAYLHKLRREDEDFAEAWGEAVDAAGDVLEEEAIRRANEGIIEEIYYKGEVVGERLLYSDQLLMFLLRGNNPGKYNQGGAGGAQINVKFGVAVLPMTAASEADWEAKAIAMHDNQTVIGLSDDDIEKAVVTPLSMKRGN